MKKIAIAAATLVAIVLGGPISAADMPARGPVYKAAPAPVFDWTGFYVGAHAGYGWENGSDASGFVGGLQVGYNWQLSRNWVFGIEGDISGTDINDATLGIPVHVDYLASIRARLGYTWDRMMLYGTGGWGYARVGSLGFHQTGDAYVLGLGLEWMFSNNWSARAEFLHYEFDDNGLPGNAYAQAFRLGVNYRFGR